MSLASLGKYQLLKSLARGGMAEIYVARSQAVGVDQIVAVKRVLPTHTKHLEFVRAFIDEARLAASLHHPNIVQVFDVGTEGGNLFLVMEYLHGENLSTLLTSLRERRKVLPIEQALSIVIGAAAGLHHAHEKKGPDGKSLNIVHRDVTPENVIVTYDGGVKVCDFGIAKAGNRLAESSQPGFQAKAPYLSPEQCRSEVLDRRSDVFALGIILYELTTGTRLFKGASAVDIMAKITDAPIEPPSKRKIGFPPDLDAIVMKALSREREGRQATAQTLQGELEAYAREHKLAVSTMALAGFMKSVFGAKIEAWREAEMTGTLAEHLTRETRPVPPRPRADTAEPLSEDDLEELGEIDEEAPTVAVVAPAEPPAPAAAPVEPPLPTTPEAIEESLGLPKRSTRKRWIVAGVAAAALLAGTCAVIASNDDAPGPSAGVASSSAGSTVNKTATQTPPPPAPAPAAADPAIPVAAAPSPSPVEAPVAPPSAAPPPAAPAPAPSPGFVRVNSSPHGATITVDGQEWKEHTPAVVDGLAPGDHQISLALDGRLSHDEVVTVQSRKTTRLEVKLEKDPALAAADPTPATAHTGHHKTKHEPVADTTPPPADPTPPPTPPPSPDTASPPPPDANGASSKKFDAAAWRRQMWEKKKQPKAP